MDARFEGLSERKRQSRSARTRAGIGVFGVQLYKAVKCYECELKCYKTVEEDSGTRQEIDARES